MPYFILPGALDMKMCSISVEPMPSRISTPKRFFHSSPTCLGQRFAGRHAQAQPCADPFSRRAAASARIAAYSVGAPKNSVGWSRFNTAKIARRRRPSGSSTAVAPTDIGNVSALPRP